ncbi:hypothetical protein V5F44_19735 [Xanthobacter sp. V2C-8]|uniref:hypothetical protein n=1 Tax=Xanthobacter albus TaxID=3119929 RepID=UPI003728D61A
MTGRAYVALNWERAADGALSPYLTIARHDQPVERIPLTTQDVARLLADGAYLWSVVEPGRQGWDHSEEALEMVGSDRPASVSEGMV